MHAQATAHRTRAHAPWQERFWRYLIPSDAEACWEWQGSRDARGYGRLQRGKRGEGVIRAHRASWEIHTGADPGDLDVLHRCDNPPCCNPGHLFVGTARDNGRDMEAKGRTGRVFGAANGKTRIPDETVRLIRAAAERGSSYGALAHDHGLTEKYVGYLVRGERRAAAGGPIRGAATP